MALAAQPSTTLEKLPLNANVMLVVITRIVEILFHPFLAPTPHTAIQTHKLLEQTRILVHNIVIHRLMCTLQKFLLEPLAPQDTQPLTPRPHTPRLHTGRLLLGNQRN